MDLKDSQLAVDQWIKNHGVRYFNELTNMAQLTEDWEKLLVLLRVGMENKVKRNQTSKKISARN